MKVQPKCSHCGRPIHQWSNGVWYHLVMGQVRCTEEEEFYASPESGLWLHGGTRDTLWVSNPFVIRVENPVGGIEHYVPVLGIEVGISEPMPLKRSTKVQIKHENGLVAAFSISTAYIREHIIRIEEEIPATDPTPAPVVPTMNEGTYGLFRKGEDHPCGYIHFLWSGNGDPLVHIDALASYEVADHLVNRPVMQSLVVRPRVDQPKTLADLVAEDLGVPDELMFTEVPASAPPEPQESLQGPETPKDPAEPPPVHWWIFESGWVQCNGQNVAIKDFPELYDVIGRRYLDIMIAERMGAEPPDPETHFILPRLVDDDGDPTHVIQLETGHPDPVGTIRPMDPQRFQHT